MKSWRLHTSCCILNLLFNYNSLTLSPPQTNEPKLLPLLTTGFQLLQGILLREARQWGMVMALSYVYD